MVTLSVPRVASSDSSVMMSQRLLVLVALLGVANAQSGHAGHNHGGSSATLELCGCAKDEDEHPFTIDCTNAASRMAAAEANLNAAGPSPPGGWAHEHCEDLTDKTRQTAFFIIQSHHDYCPHDTLTTSQEHLVHDWEGACTNCQIYRQHRPNLVECPEISAHDCEAAVANYVVAAAFFVLNSTCTAATEAAPTSGKCCTDTGRSVDPVRNAAEQGAFRQLLALHDLCPNNMPAEVELAIHDYEHSCEDYFCNAVESGYDGTVCPSPPPPPKPPPSPAPPSPAAGPGLLIAIIVGAVVAAVLVVCIVYMMMQEKKGKPIFTNVGEIKPTTSA